MIFGFITSFPENVSRISTLFSIEVEYDKLKTKTLCVLQQSIIFHQLSLRRQRHGNPQGKIAPVIKDFLSILYKRKYGTDPGLGKEDRYVGLWDTWPGM